MIRKIIIIALILSVFLIGCQKVIETPAETSTEPAAEETTDINIDTEVSGIDTLNEDLNVEELESIESDLDEINW